MPPAPSFPSLPGLRPSRRSCRPIIAAVACSLVLLLGACSSDSGGSDATESTGSIEAGGRSAIDGLVSLCNSALTGNPPDVERLAIDPAVTGQVLSIPDDLVTQASQEFYDCLGAENTAGYLAADFIVTGVPLPEGTAACLLADATSDGPAMLEANMHRTRLEPPKTGQADSLINAMLGCVPGRYLAAALQGANPFGYAASVDEACLDSAQTADDAAMRVFWRLQLSATGSGDPVPLDDQETATIVAPLYRCIDTGTFIVADPSTGSAVSTSSRNCISEAAESHGYWESKLAARPFDQVAYEADITGCLSPEEAEFILGTPIPADDPVASKFNAVSDCWTERPEAAGRTLTAAVTSLSDDELTSLAVALADCAGRDGVAGHLAAIKYGNRALPAGSYDCFASAVVEPTATLTGRLFVEAGQPPTQADGLAYLEAVKRCIPLGIATRPLFSDYTSVGIVDTIDFACVDKAYEAAPAAEDAFWQGTVFGGFASLFEPTDLARQAVAPMHGCVDPGRGFAAVAASTGVALSAETIVCINDSVRALEHLEFRIAGLEPPAKALNQAIADCLSDEEVKALQS